MLLSLTAYENAGDCHYRDDGVSVLFSIPLTKYNEKAWVILYEINIRELWKVGGNKETFHRREYPGDK